MSDPCCQAYMNKPELLKKLDDSESKLAEIIAAANAAGWNGVTNSKFLSQFITDLSAEKDKTTRMFAELVSIGIRFRMTPIVDDDFPAMRDQFDSKLREATNFLQER